jgi:hypothetical protein
MSWYVRIIKDKKEKETIKVDSEEEGISLYEKYIQENMEKNKDESLEINVISPKQFIPHFCGFYTCRLCKFFLQYHTWQPNELISKYGKFYVCSICFSKAIYFYEKTGKSIFCEETKK